MNEQKASAQESLQGLSQGDATKLSFLQDLIARSYTESGLDPQRSCWSAWRPWRHWMRHLPHG